MPCETQPSETTSTSLLEELDARQNELLDQLDQLNARIQAVIAKWAPSAPANDTVATKSAA